jgi:hypothetical protein
MRRNGPLGRTARLKLVDIRTTSDVLNPGPVEAINFNVIRCLLTISVPALLSLVRSCAIPARAWKHSLIAVSVDLPPFAGRQ